jgi:hypothetical protein
MADRIRSDAGAPARRRFIKQRGRVCGDGRGDPGHCRQAGQSRRAFR